MNAGTDFNQAITTAADAARRVGSYAFLLESAGAFWLVLSMPIDAPCFYAVCPRSGSVSTHSAF